MKLYTYFLSFIYLLLFMIGYSTITSNEKNSSVYLFTIENKILNKKIYISLYEQLGLSRWKRIMDPVAIDPLKYHTFTLEKEKIEKKQYIYAVATEAVILSKNIISQQEKNALEAALITSAKKIIDSTLFSAKNSFDVGSIHFYNDYSYPLFIARYITSPTEQSLDVQLASTIFQCDTHKTVHLPVPIGYKATDVIMLASRNIDDLAEEINLKDALKKKVFITRMSFKDWKKNDTKNRYNASHFFTDDSLSIINNTSQDWIVSLYANKGEQQLQKISEDQTCKAHQKVTYDKKTLLPVSNYDYKTSLYVIFDNDVKKMKPLLSINHTLHGGAIPRSMRNVSLNRWFTEMNIPAPSPPLDQNKKEEPLSLLAHETIPDNNDNHPKNPLANNDRVTPFLTGSFDMQVTNVTSKDIFIGLYTKGRNHYSRRETSLKVSPDVSITLKFEENELLAYSVSHCELTSALAPREWATLNTQSNLKIFNEKELKIKEPMFKSNSFNIREISIENNGNNDIVVGRYEQTTPGTLTLAGIVQTIPSKNSLQKLARDNTDTPHDENKEPQDSVNFKSSVTPNFALPYTYKGFIGYQNSFSKNSMSLMNSSIDMASFFEKNHLTKIDITDKESFDAQKEFIGNCIIVENDFNSRKWTALYTMHDINLNAAESIASDRTKKYIPYYDRMKLIIKDNYFDTTLPLDVLQPFDQLFINTQTTYNYYLSDAKMATITSKEKELIIGQKEVFVPTKPLFKEREEPYTQEPLTELYDEKPLPDVFVEIKEEEPQPLKEKPHTVIMQDSLCGEKQIRVNNHSDRDILMRFYYRGFLSTTQVEKEMGYNISHGQELCFDLPVSTYLSDRYVIITLDILDFKEKYSNKEINALIKNNRAFNVEKRKEITITNF